MYIAKPAMRSRSILFLPWKNRGKTGTDIFSALNPQALGTRPILLAVNNADDPDFPILDGVHEQIRRSPYDPFSRVSDTAGTSDLRLLDEQVRRIDYPFRTSHEIASSLRFSQ